MFQIWCLSGALNLHGVRAFRPDLGDSQTFVGHISPPKVPEREFY